MWQGPPTSPQVCSWSSWWLLVSCAANLWHECAHLNWLGFVLVIFRVLLAQTPSRDTQQAGQLDFAHGMRDTCASSCIWCVMQYQQSLGMSTNIFRRQTRPRKKTMANLDNVRRTIYICDIASKANDPHVRHTMLCILQACGPVWSAEECLPSGRQAAVQA